MKSLPAMSSALLVTALLAFPTVAPAVEATVAPPGANRLSAFEWRRLDKSPVSQLTAPFAAFKAAGGTHVSLDISYVVDISEIASPTSRRAAEIDYRSRLTAYVEQASRQGLRVEALAGSPHWILPNIRYVNRIVWKYVLDFNARASSHGQRLTGVHFDLEPWGTKEWGQSKVRQTKDLLATVKDLATTQRNATAGTAVPLTFDLPFWLDGTTEPRVVVFGGKSMSPTEHALRLLDTRRGLSNAVVVMAYRDHTDGVDGSLAVSAREFELAAKYAGRTKVIIGQEIGDAQPERITFYQEGFPAMRRAMRVLDQQYSAKPGFGGFAVDDLGALAPRLR